MRILVSTALMVLCAIVGVEAAEQGKYGEMNLSQSVDRLRNAIVQIGVTTTHSMDEIKHDPSLKHYEHKTLGTGFFVNSDGYVITANHVVADIKTDKHTRITVGVAAPHVESAGVKIAENFKIIEAELVDADTLHDLAILKLKTNPFQAVFAPLINMKEAELSVPTCIVPELAPRRPKDGQNIAVSGYPFKGNILITNSGYIASSWGVESKEVQVKGAPQGLTTIDLSDVYLADVTVNPGNSGGPVYTVNEGKIIGVCVSQVLSMALTIDAERNIVPIYANGRPILYNASVANVIPIKYAVDLLKKNNIRVRVD